MAEGLVNHFLAGQWEARSAGTEPTGYVHPLAIEAMRELNIDIFDQTSKLVDEFRGLDFDAVITVCDQAAKNCPVWLGKGRVKHFGFPDPAAERGSEVEQIAAFRDVRDGLRKAIFEYLTQITAGEQ